jgi:N-acetylglucosamine kinase
MINCLDIGGSSIKGAFARSASSLISLGRVSTPLNDLDAFVSAIEEVLVRSPAAPDAMVAISIAGVVDPDSGTIKVANIPCIDGLPLAAVLADRLARPVIIGNDADCFVLAEAVVGAGKSHRIVFGAILGTGVGGGLVIDGRLVTGRGGYAGEWGHAPVAATRVGTPPVELPRFACGCGMVVWTRWAARAAWSGCTLIWVNRELTASTLSSSGRRAMAPPRARSNAIWRSSRRHWPSSSTSWGLASCR